MQLGWFIAPRCASINHFMRCCSALADSDLSDPTEYIDVPSVVVHQTEPTRAE
jgi:hypothetical protein